MKKFCVVSYIVADKHKLISRNVYNDIHISNSRYRLGFAPSGTMNSWRDLTPLNVVYHCSHPFRWFFFVRYFIRYNKEPIPIQNSISIRLNRYVGYHLLRSAKKAIISMTFRSYLENEKNRQLKHKLCAWIIIECEVRA